MVAQWRCLLDMGPKAVLLKGGTWRGRHLVATRLSPRRVLHAVWQRASTRATPWTGIAATPLPSPAQLAHGAPLHPRYRRPILSPRGYPRRRPLSYRTARPRAPIFTRSGHDPHHRHRRRRGEGLLQSRAVLLDRGARVHLKSTRANPDPAAGCSCGGWECCAPYCEGEAPKIPCAASVNKQAELVGAAYERPLQRCGSLSSRRADITSESDRLCATHGYYKTLTATRDRSA